MPANVQPERPVASGHRRCVAPCRQVKAHGRLSRPKKLRHRLDHAGHGIVVDVEVGDHADGMAGLPKLSATAQ
jgi:hypothetical protein